MKSKFILYLLIFVLYSCAGKLVHETTDYFNENNPKQKVFYKVTRSKKQKIKEINYFLNGQVKTEISFTDTIKNGPYKKYYESGVLEEEGQYLNNELHGEGYRYFNNGRLKSQGVFKSGKLNGQGKRYYDNGMVMVCYQNITKTHVKWIRHQWGIKKPLVVEAL